jgi:hypothetical protein
MGRDSQGATRCTAGTPAHGADRRALLGEISAFTRKYGDILARYHRYTTEELEQLGQECRRLHDEACSRGACGSAGELAELEYLIGRAKEMRAKLDGDRSGG